MRHSMALWVEWALTAAASSGEWIPIVAVVLTAILALIGGLATIIFQDVRQDVKRAVNTLESVLHRQDSMDERVQWLEGFHPTKEQLVARSRGNGGDGG